MRGLWVRVRAGVRPLAEPAVGANDALFRGRRSGWETASPAETVSVAIGSVDLG